MALKCNKDCGIKDENFDLKIIRDIGNSCPNCGKGKIILKGYCNDCEDEIIIKEYKEYYRCPNCNTTQGLDNILIINRN